MTVPKHRLFLTAAAASALASVTACSSDNSGGAEPGPEEAPAGPSGPYENGTYTATGDYANPDGGGTIEVAITIEDNVITDVTVTPLSSGTSQQYQMRFANGVADEVVGVALDEVNVGRVSGSSLTWRGFNRAVEQIQEDATA